jgi:hypothetical protein
MASKVVLQASQTPSCLLLKLPPELRLYIYAYTHRFQISVEINDYGRENLSKAWESTQLVKLAAICRLIAEEARRYVRSLPSLDRRIWLDIERLRVLTSASPSLPGGRSEARYCVLQIRKVPAHSRHPFSHP